MGFHLPTSGSLQYLDPFYLLICSHCLTVSFNIFPGDIFLNFIFLRVSRPARVPRATCFITWLFFHCKLYQYLQYLCKYQRNFLLPDCKHPRKRNNIQLALFGPFRIYHDTQYKNLVNISEIKRV